MDKPAMMGENAIKYGTTDSYGNLSEIWPFSINGGGESGIGGAGGDGGLELQRQKFVPSFSFSQFGEAVVDVGAGGGRKRREAVSTSGGGNSKRVKGSDRNPKCEGEGEGEGSATRLAEHNSKPEPPKGYIHVRARRGQATDSHSLAERARREKISERMRILQDLVPGCNKVIGKASVLDEIINYIQSLQRQVEFLSMKLEAVNSRMNMGVEGYPSKEFGEQAFEPSGVVYGSQAPRDYGRGASPEWLHMQIGGGGGSSGFERQT